MAGVARTMGLKTMPSFDMSIPPGYFIREGQQAQQWMQHLPQSHRRNNGLGVDTETTGLSKIRDRVVVFSVSDGANRVCLPAEFLPMYKQLLEDPNINLDGTKIIFDGHMMANSGVDLSKAGDWRCTLVQSFLKNENNQGRHGLKESIVDNFGRTTPTFEETFGKVPPKKVDKTTGMNLNPTVGDLIKRAFEPPPLSEFVQRARGDGVPEDSAVATGQEEYEEALRKQQAAADYASLDAYNSTTLRSHFDDQLEEIAISSEYGAMGNLKNYYYSVEVPFTKLLYKLERRGITVDKGYLEEQRGPMEREMNLIERGFAQYTGRLMNLNSPKDLAWFFFDHLKKPVYKETKGGTSGVKKPSTDYEVLDFWAGQGDYWAQQLLRYRSIKKIHGTYVNGLEEWLDAQYRIHTSLNQIGAVTMRLSSSEPNLQNIPRPSEDQFKIREAFIPGERMIFVIADYEQLEMRLMAHFSRDEKMINAIKNGIDLHCLTVSEMYGIPYEEVLAAKKADGDIKKGKRKEPLTPREEELLFFRQAAKATGFGIIYGIGGEHLARNLTQELKRPLSPEEGFALIRRWFAIFPGVKSYIESTKQQIWQHGYVQTLVGRFRRFGVLEGMSKKDRALCERQGVNSIIQGTASDIAKKSMLIAEEDPVLKGFGARMLLQIHDELIFEVPDHPEVVKGVKARVEEIMAHPFSKDLLVPIPAAAGSGYSWASAK
jgi:DNA polymerase I-like protein with 3'-5' exonuclease and polymerase domains